MTAIVRQTAWFVVMGFAIAPAPAKGEAEVYIGTDTVPMPSLPDAIAAPRQPVLFVHGHNTDDALDADFNYRKNFHTDPPGALTSFQNAIDDPVNACATACGRVFTRTHPTRRAGA